MCLEGSRERVLSFVVKLNKSLLLGVFVCVTLISVKSKYGSRSGSCAGIISH